MSSQKLPEIPKLSVILASQNAVATVAECLRVVESQCAGKGFEIVVVDNSTDGTQETIVREFQDVKFIRAPKEKLIPELWGIGISHSAGEIVALTTTHFIPAENWIAEILKIHQSPCAGVGGAIENSERAGIVSWAVYFCRYSSFALPFPEQRVSDFAADNASYKRNALERVGHDMSEGFWEFFIHLALQKEQMPLLLTPKIVVFHQDSFTFYGFLRQRFRHGVEFGASRAASISDAKRIALIVLSPLIPLIYLYRISRRVLGKKRNVGKYLMSLPVLTAFLLSWSIGELCGYLQKSG